MICLDVFGPKVIKQQRKTGFEVARRRFSNILEALGTSYHLSSRAVSKLSTSAFDGPSFWLLWFLTAFHRVLTCKVSGARSLG